VVQGHRYNLIEDLGPITDTYNVTLAFPLYFMWEPLFVILSGFFGMMNVRIILKRRKLFDMVLSLGSTNVSKDRYMRLLCLTIWGVVVHTPLATWIIIVNATQYEVFPWISWEDTHSNYGRIEYINRFMLSILPHKVIATSIAWWSLPLCGLSFFVLFGFGEAATPYQPLIAGCLRPFGIQYPREEKKTKSTKRTWLDFILRRPGKPTSKETFGWPTTLPFGTGHLTSGQTQTGTFAVDSVITVPQFTFQTIGDTTTQGSNEVIEEKDKTENVAQMKVTFDVEAQTFTSEQWRHEIPERDPEWTEEVTF
jgi:hypothetical protein